MVEVGFPGGPRLEWYDRNPQHVLVGYSAEAVAPHSVVARWSYTVPTGKKAFIEIMHATLQRAVAATTADIAFASLSLWPEGEAILVPIIAWIRENDVGNKDRAVMGQGAILLTGDLVQGATMDDSDGGSIDYNVSGKITEFDA